MKKKKDISKNITPIPILKSLSNQMYFKFKFKTKLVYVCNVCVFITMTIPIPLHRILLKNHWTAGELVLIGPDLDFMG